MSSKAESASHAAVVRGRRNFLKLPLAAGAAGVLTYAALSRKADQPEAQPTAQAAAPRKPPPGEHDENNVKLAHRVSSTLTDDELLFLQQIGLRWARVELRPEEAELDALGRVQK